ncbi:MAG: PrsW family glutamic-type intramembrane protease [Myxococcaceae bacterium]
MHASPLQMLLSPAGLGLLRNLALFAFAAFAWLAYFKWKYPARAVSWRLELLGVASGAVSVALAFLGFKLLSRAGLTVTWNEITTGQLPRAAQLSAVIGLVEEGAKLLPAAISALVMKRFNRRIDGLLFATCAGIGFATAEGMTLWVAGELGAEEQLPRAAAAGLTHALFAAPWGYALVAGVRDGRSAELVGGFAISAAAHGLYDLLLGRGASGPVRILAALVVLSLWIWFIRSVPFLRLRSQRRLAAQQVAQAQPVPVLNAQPNVNSSASPSQRPLESKFFRY